MVCVDLLLLRHKVTIYTSLQFTYLNALGCHLRGEGLQTSAGSMQLGKGVHVALIHLGLGYHIHAHHIVSSKPERV